MEGKFLQNFVFSHSDNFHETDESLEQIKWILSNCNLKINGVTKYVKDTITNMYIYLYGLITIFNQC